MGALTNTRTQIHEVASFILLGAAACSEVNPVFLESTYLVPFAVSVVLIPNFLNPYSNSISGFLLLFGCIFLNPRSYSDFDLASS